MKMKLTVVDTPGFGDQINNDNWWVLPTPGSLNPHKCHRYCLFYRGMFIAVFSFFSSSHVIVYRLLSHVQLGAHFQVHQRAV